MPLVEQSVSLIQYSNVIPNSGLKQMQIWFFLLKNVKCRFVVSFLDF